MLVNVFDAGTAGMRVWVWMYSVACSPRYSRFLCVSVSVRVRVRETVCQYTHAITFAIIYYCRYCFLFSFRCLPHFNHRVSSVPTIHALFSLFSNFILHLSSPTYPHHPLSLYRHAGSLARAIRCHLVAPFPALAGHAVHV
jgi:hypothetical protein